MKRKFKFYLKIVYRACVFSKTVVLLTLVLVFLRFTYVSLYIG